MLFPYTYVPHQMEKMQAFIDFIFFEVWCQAPVSKSYSLDLFDANPELHEVMTAFHYDDSKGAEFFSGHVERIHGLFVALSDTQIDLFRQWYRANNDIEKVCANDPGISVIRYSDLPDELEDVRDQLKSFFKGLYSHLDLAALKGKIGELDDHYDNAFWSANKKGKCPFCGIADIKGTHHTKREAYDHYLPKALYPFNSINFRNLVPACHGCNSAYKGSKDPAHNAAEQRRKAFYPYAAAVHGIEVKVALRHSDVDNLAPEDITLQFGPLHSTRKSRLGRTCTASRNGTVESFWMATAKRGFRKSSTSGAGRMNRLAAGVNRPTSTCGIWPATPSDPPTPVTTS